MSQSQPKKRRRLTDADGKEHTEQAWKAHVELRLKPVGKELKS